MVSQDHVSDNSEPQESGIISMSIHTLTGKIKTIETDPLDSLMEIRQALLESPETCHMTCFHFETLDGVHLNDFMEINSIPELKKSDYAIKMVLDNYTERAVREHVRRFSEILVHPPTALKAQTWLETLKQDSENEAKKNQLGNLNGIADIISNDGVVKLEVLSESSKDKKCSTEPCINSIKYSPWNPAPGNRRLLGDLLYLEIVTVENHCLHLTASVSGFFVNQCSDNVFNPAPATASYHSHSLVEILRKCSVSFSNLWESLIRGNSYQHPFALIPTPLPVNSWVGEFDSGSYTPDYNRAEQALLDGFGMDDRGIVRSWNEEFQSTLEQKVETVYEKLAKDRVLYRLSIEFSQACIKGAKAIIEGSIPPMNPNEPSRAAVWVYNNIFFSQANDGRDLYSQFGGEDANYKLAGLDLKGVASVNSALAGIESRKLYTLVTCIVDYMGRRLICQAVIPGILHGDQASSLVWGYLDDNVSVDPDSRFYQFLLDFTNERTMFKDCDAIDPSGKHIRTPLGMETKAIIGSDKRFYLLDLFRTMPRDSNYCESTKIACVLREELVNAFCHTLAVENSMTAIKDNGENPENLSRRRQEVYVKSLSEIKFNLNAFTPYENSKDLSQDKKTIEDASAFLVSKVIPRFVEDLKTEYLIPVDGETLSGLMHSRGINMRYLGKVMESLGPDSSIHLRKLVLKEMIIRSSKHYLNKLLRIPAAFFATEFNSGAIVSTADLLATFLNNMLGCSAFGHSLSEEMCRIAESIISCHWTKVNALNSHDNKMSTLPKKKSEKKNFVERTSDGKRVPRELTSALLIWASIRSNVLERFSYQLPIDMSEFFNSSDRMSILRGLCRSTGIQVTVGQYNFSHPAPFTTASILDLYPLQRMFIPSQSDAEELLGVAKLHMGKGNLSSAYESLMQALQILHHVVGPMHVDVMHCYSAIAAVAYYTDDLNQALEQQQRALIIAEKLLGKDHPETFHAYSAYAMYLRSKGMHNLAFRYMKECLALSEIVSGFDHPETAAALYNLGVIVFELGKTSLAIELIETAIKGFENTIGHSKMQTATCFHALAIVSAAQANFRASIEFEKKARDIYISLFGESHSRPSTSQQWVAEFTRLAVQLASGNTSKLSPDILKNNPLAWIRSALFPKVVKPVITLEMLKALQAEATKMNANETAQSESPSIKAGVDEESPATLVTKSQKKRLKRKGKGKKASKEQTEHVVEVVDHENDPTSIRV